MQLPQKPEESKKCFKVVIEVQYLDTSAAVQNFYISVWEELISRNSTLKNHHNNSLKFKTYYFVFVCNFSYVLCKTNTSGSIFSKGTSSAVPALIWIIPNHHKFMKREDFCRKKMLWMILPYTSHFCCELHSLNLISSCSLLQPDTVCDRV